MSGRMSIAYNTTTQECAHMYIYVDPPLELPSERQGRMVAETV